MMFGRYTSILSLLALLAMPLAAQNTGTVAGVVTDETGGSVPDATVSVLKAGAIVRSVQTDIRGVFSAPNISPGAYSVRISHAGFNPIELRVQVAAGSRATVNTQLKVQEQAQSVTVQGDSPTAVSVDPTQNANALVLRQTEIDALPDDPDDLASDLAQLAGPAAGPNGGQIYIDGFTGGRLPPKESIREIRINQNPFSSEFDKLGYGRIEILTKPGSDKFHGQAFFNDSDAVFNARNPFLDYSPDFSSRQYGGNLSGPLGKKASLFFDVEEREINDSGVVATDILNSNLAIIPYNTAIATPQRRTDFSPRVDYQLNDKNTLVVKYSFLRNTVGNSGVGTFSLANQGVNTESFEHSIQITETAVVSPSMINETRFRWLRDNENDTAVSPGLTVDVQDAEITGGNSTPNNSTNLTNFELQNYTSITHGTQAFKAGIRLRSYEYSVYTPQNFDGTFFFAGGPAPQLDANNNPVIGSDGADVMITESSLEQYRRTLLGLGPSLGGGASQYSVGAGNPYAAISQLDAGLFVQDDWRVKPSLTINLGLRYEIQNQISDYRDWAPRVGFAWSPDSKGGRAGKTVIRGGAGLFYDRFSYLYSLNGELYNGQNIQRYILNATGPFPYLNTQLDANGNLVAPATSSLNQSNLTVEQVDGGLVAPYVLQTALGVERSLPKNTRLSLNYMHTRGVHQLRTVNINAPDPYLGADSPQPYGAVGNIYDYQSTGYFNQNQLILTVNTQFNRAVSLFSFYQLGSAHSDTDGINTFPSNQYNFQDEYGRAQFDIHHRIFLGGSVTARYGLRFSPFIVYHSSAPFNITAGEDYLDQTVFTERPSFTNLPCNGTTVLCTAYGTFNIAPGANETIIPRNYGNGPAYFSMNLRVSKTWGFGERTRGNVGGGSYGGGGFGGPRGGGGGGPRGGPGGMFGDSSTGRKYNITLTAQARNLFNNVNYANPIGVITSPLFGLSNQIANFGPGGSSADNRRLEFGLRFAF